MSTKRDSGRTTYRAGLLLRLGILDRDKREARTVRHVQIGLARSLGKETFDDLDARQKLLVEAASVLAVIMSFMAAHALAKGHAPGGVDKAFIGEYSDYTGHLLRALDSLFGAAKGRKKAKEIAGPDVGALLRKGDDGDGDDDDA